FFRFFAILDMSVGRITFKHLSCSVGNIGQVTEQGAFSAFVNGGVLFLLAPYGLKKVDDMSGGHISAAAQLRSTFASAWFAFPDQFPASVKQLVGIPAHVDRTFRSVDAGAPP